MKKVIYFTNGEGIKPFIFVSAYRRKRLFRKEKLELSYFPHELDIEDDMASDIIYAVKRNFPDAVVGCDTVDNFSETMCKYRYYVVCKFIKSGGFYGFDTGMTSSGEREWTTDIMNAQLCYEHTSAEEGAELLARSTGERYTCADVYVLNVNPLSEQKFVIVCKGKKSGRNQFYARSEGTRLRLVKTSDAAMKFNYNLAIGMYDELKAKNKAFLYTVMPYIQNVNCADLERMYDEKKIPLAIMMTTKIKWMGSE